jgi:hypothetical protein
MHRSGDRGENGVSQKLWVVNFFFFFFFLLFCLFCFLGLFPLVSLAYGGFDVFFFLCGLVGERLGGWSFFLGGWGAVWQGLDYSYSVLALPMRHFRRASTSKKKAPKNSPKKPPKPSINAKNTKKSVKMSFFLLVNLSFAPYFFFFSLVLRVPLVLGIHREPLHPRARPRFLLPQPPVPGVK